LCLELSKEHFAFSIIEEMIQNDPRSRPNMSAVVDALQLPAPSACLENSGNEHVSAVKRQRDLENEQDTSNKGKKLRFDKFN
jgi:hypothetical protein